MDGRVSRNTQNLMVMAVGTVALWLFILAVIKLT
jgi:hypothetical protein